MPRFAPPLFAALAWAAALPAAPDYNRDVKPILARKCFACHGPDEGHRAAKLRLDTREGATVERKSGHPVSPGKPDESTVIERVTAADDEGRMPPAKSDDRLTAAEVETLRQWVAAGGEYAPHWSLVPPRRPALPGDGGHPIDRFIDARLRAANLAPNPPADKFTLLRRLSLDLRGLPPTPAEIDEFATDDRPGSYERAVDRFLADPAYGERMARVWLDLARYADSAGYGSDPLRPQMWRWRDWVIEALNKNKRYDEFTVEQLAGDMLPGATLEHKIATAFHRNTMTNTEGGTDDEEFRVAAVKDRVDTTMQVWMGLTAGCAKCHTHKFDPITHEEYYRLYAVFNGTADADRNDEMPAVTAPTKDQEEKIKSVDARVAELRRRLGAEQASLIGKRRAWESMLRPAIGECDDVTRVASNIGPIAETRHTLSAKGVTGFGLVFQADGASKSELTNLAVVAGGPEKPAAGKFVRVELPGGGQMLSLAEVQVFRNGVNVAAKSKARQSSTDYDGPPELAVDGNTDGHYFTAKSTTHTAAETNPWWEVELPSPGAIDRVVVWNRTDGFGGRLANFRVSVLDDKRNIVWQTTVAAAPAPKAELVPGTSAGFKVADAYLDWDADAKEPPTLRPLSEGVYAVDNPAGGRFGAVLVLDKATDFDSVPLTFRLAGRGLALREIVALREPTLLNRLALPKEVRAAVDLPDSRRTPGQRQTVIDHFSKTRPELRPLLDELAKLEAERPKPVNLPVMQELPADKRRKSRVHLKGDFLNPGIEVTPGLPAALHKLPDGYKPDRLGLAGWLLSPHNPLTARVAVNRVWATLFGVGMVETEEDFGVQGEQPSHPELLDWLAVEFRETGWDVKRLIKLVVTSEAYRRSPRVTADHLAKDPRNRLLARAPRLRLEAETVRDQALALSGLLSRKVGGPSVFPVQPAGLWQAAFNGQRNYPTSGGEDRYRRGLYTFWRRTVPYPSMAAFDAPSRETCSIKRTRTNTPLQAFVTLNDPCYVEAAQALARRIMKEGGATPEDRARYGLRVALCRPPAEAQVAPLVKLYNSEVERLKSDKSAATKLATEPLGPLPAGVDAAEAAAWTTVANVLLNLDGVLTKG